MSEQPKLLDRVREELRVRHFSCRTEDAYVMWIRRFILHHGKRAAGYAPRYATGYAADWHGGVSDILPSDTS
jgi:hypothetical protein